MKEKQKSNQDIFWAREIIFQVLIIITFVIFKSAITEVNCKLMLVYKLYPPCWNAVIANARLLPVEAGNIIVGAGCVGCKFRQHLR